MDADEIRGAIAHKQELVDIHKRNLCKLEKQAALCGMIIPLSVLNEIEYAQAQITLLEQQIIKLKDALSALRIDLKFSFADKIKQAAITEANREPYYLYGSYRRSVHIPLCPVYDIDILCFLNESGS